MKMTFEQLSQNLHGSSELSDGFTPSQPTKIPPVRRSTAVLRWVNLIVNGLRETWNQR
jgi:hypothetical protein